MKNYDDYKSDLEKWQFNWDEALKNLTPKTPTTKESFVNDREINNFSDQEAENWKNLLAEKTKEQAKAMIDAPNPVSYNTVGKDSQVRITPNFTDGPELLELNNLKVSLEALERAVHSAEVRGEKSESLKKQIDELRDKFDELSNALNAQPEDVS